MIMVDEYDVQIVQPTSEWHSKNDAEMMVQHECIPQSQKIFKEYYLTILRRLRDCHWLFDQTRNGSNCSATVFAGFFFFSQF